MTASPICGGASARARRLGRFHRLRSACSRRRHSTSPPRIRSFRTAGSERESAAAAPDQSRRQRDRGEGCADEDRVARADTTYLVTNMMRSVLSEGTGAAVRASGLQPRRRGQDRNDQRSSRRMVRGFTPELLTVVWVGLDDNQALGLSGAQAALPIWVSFMQRALAGRGDHAFDVPDNINFVDIDRDTGATAAPGCLRVFSESFIAGAEPRSM